MIVTRTNLQLASPLVAPCPLPQQSVYPTLEMDDILHLAVGGLLSQRDSSLPTGAGTSSIHMTVGIPPLKAKILRGSHVGLGGLPLQLFRAVPYRVGMNQNWLRQRNR